ncbi:hypothetical protein [Flavobacterium caeni]|uniref:Uncharacterized protein n=1 Tax=Flavobacterium caeni TaxID=490189 RepID=A0A1G5FF23_9FLAO|nr:hypothetical protein [Flavobacterium caeni]SCY37480.1 hypothetical protein SAMN02927903_01265 [Flavobacterium caeni]
MRTMPLIALFAICSASVSGQQTHTYYGVAAGANIGTPLDGNNSSGFGYGALNNNTTVANTAFGAFSLFNTGTHGGGSGSYNAAFGTYALYNNTTGRYNCAFGDQALLGNLTGYSNVVVGRRAMESNKYGNGNIIMGYGTLVGIDGPEGSCDGNVAIGDGLGQWISQASGNVLIGNKVATGLSGPLNNRLMIDNWGTNNPLLYGEFDNDLFRINGNTQINAVSANTSGLRFMDLNANTPNIQNNTNGKFLTVNANGDVILEKIVTGGVGGPDTSIYLNDGAITNTVNHIRNVDMKDNNIWFNTRSSERNGRIYIGSDAIFPTETGNYRLYVEGGVLTERVKVALRNGNPNNWADYVFGDNYTLMPLDEVDAFIRKHKHLPNIPSATDLANNGLDLGEMQAKQMEKIEELTLHLINQNKTIEIQSRQLQSQQTELAALKEQMEQLIKQSAKQ